MQIPGISSFEQDILMLVSYTTTHYHKCVSYPVGSSIINQVVNSIMDEELRSLLQSWKLAYVGTVLSKSSQIGDREFDLSQVKGNVVITKKVTIPAFQHRIKIRGILTRYDPQNLSGREVTLKPHTEVGMVSAANKISPILTPEVIEGDVQDDKNDKKVKRKSVQVDLSESKLKQIEVDPEEILQKVDLSRTTDWDSVEQWDAHNLIHEYACIFSWNDLDLGKTWIVKHLIRLTYPTPFKACYQCIPPRNV